jgi:hypothetical protein
MHIALAGLRRWRLINVWPDRQILPGPSAIKTLYGSHIIILLVRKHYIASNCRWSVETTEAIRRYEDGWATVAPVAETGRLEDEPFDKLNRLPKYGKLIVEWQNPDAAWADIAAGFGRLVTTRRTRSAFVHINLGHHVLGKLSDSQHPDYQNKGHRAHIFLKDRRGNMRWSRSHEG